MMLNLWRTVREAHYDAIQQYFGKDEPGNAILLLRSAIQRTETLIVALEKEIKRRERG